MLKNYLKVAIRNMLQNRIFSLINVLGLAISMSVSLVVIMLVADQMSYDRFNTKARNIYRVNFENLNDDGMFNRMATSPPMLGPTLLENYTGVEQVARLRDGFGNGWVEFDVNVNVPVSGFFADPSVLDMFEYELEYGDPITCLTQPRSVVLTAEATEKLFTRKNPVGEVLRVGELGEFRVTGILKKTDHKSHIKFEALASMSSLDALVADSLLRSGPDSWNDIWSFWTYLRLEEGETAGTVEENLEIINQQQYAEDEERNLGFYLQGLLEINPGPLMGNQIGPGMPLFMIYFLAGLCSLIMVSACFNYTNLSIARALSRAKEVGIRKTTGARRQQIFLQFLSEAVIVALFALLVSFLLLQVLGPAFRSLKFVQMLFIDLSFNMTVLMVCVLLAITVGIMAGIFPAIFLSSFKPISVLKGLSDVKLFSKLVMRRILIVAQFTLSLFLIVSVTLIQKQLNMMVSADYGFRPENIINVRLHDTSYANLKNDLSARSGVKSVSGSSHTPGTGRMYSFDVRKDGDDEEIEFSYFIVDRNYVTNMELHLIAGEDFPLELEYNGRERFILINEAAVTALGLTSPFDAVDKIIIGEDGEDLQILGVLADYNHQPMVSKISPLALRYIPDRINQAQVKYFGEKEMAIQHIESSWAVVNPDYKVDYKEMEVEIAEFYEFMFSDLINITLVISSLAIVIACLGLLGMAIFTAETRMKEVSIRKVLGANNRELAVALSKGHFLLLVVSIAVGLPLAWLFNNMWLNNLAYRVEIGLDTAVIGIGIILVLGLITVISQTLRAANSNIVGALRGE